MKIIQIVNNSRGSLELSYPGGILTIPGHCFENDPFCAEVSDDVVATIEKKIDAQPAYVYMAGDVETVETPVPGDDGKGNDGQDGQPDSPPPDKDEFIAGCSARAIEGEENTYEVKLPAGDVMTITGVSHHMQAKSSVYNQLYGGSE